MNVRPLLLRCLQVPAARLISSRIDSLNGVQYDGMGGTVGVFFVGAGPRGYGPWEFEKLGERAGNFGSNGPIPSPQLALWPFALWEGGAGSTRARLNPFGLPRDRRPAGGPGGQGRTVDEIQKVPM